MVRKMTHDEENLKEEYKIKQCVRCGYCCITAPCHWGIKYYIENKTRKEREKFPVLNKCPHLHCDDPYLGTYKCEIWEYIKYMEAGSKYPMCGSGCSSTLFNKYRENVIRTIAEMAADRLAGEITYEDR